MSTELLIEASPSLIKDSRKTVTSTALCIVKSWHRLSVNFFISKPYEGACVRERLYACDSPQRTSDAPEAATEN